MNGVSKSYSMTGWRIGYAAGPKEIIRATIESVAYPTPAKRPAYSVLNKSKIKTAFELEIPHWETSLKKCISFVEKQKKIN